MDQELRKIEEIELYYLNAISKYISADIHGLIEMLESHNKTWKYWLPEVAKTGSYFDTGSERVIYMLLNRGDILGFPNANPVGSDNSFLKYDNFFKSYLAINLDVKSIKANTNLNDILNNFPIGKNQNSYKCNIITKRKKQIESRGYSPGLLTSYGIEDQEGILRKYLTLSYEIVILYDQEKTKNKFQEKTIAIFIACIPNGSLYKIYGDDVFDAGKTSSLKMKPKQKVFYKENEFFISEGNETLEKICKNYKLSKDLYVSLNGRRNLLWNLDARFNYIKNYFKLLDSKEVPRVTKLYFDEARFDRYFYSKNKSSKKKNKRESIRKFLFELDTI